MAEHGDLPPAVLAALEKAEQLKVDGKHREALAILEQLLQNDPANVPVLEEIADNELSLERFSRAEQAAQRALKLDSASYTALYILGFLRSRAMQWEESVTFLQESNRLRPNNSEILRCLGWSLFNAGKRPQGVVTLERALNLDPDNILVLCDLGVVYLECKNFRKARALFTRALDLDPGNDRARECAAAVDRFERMFKAEAKKT